MSDLSSNIKITFFFFYIIIYYLRFIFGFYDIFIATWDGNVFKFQHIFYVILSHFDCKTAKKPDERTETAFLLLLDGLISGKYFKYFKYINIKYNKTVSIMPKMSWSSYFAYYNVCKAERIKPAPALLNVFTYFLMHVIKQQL